MYLAVRLCVHCKFFVIRWCLLILIQHGKTYSWRLRLLNIREVFCAGCKADEPRFSITRLLIAPQLYLSIYVTSSH